MDRHPTQTCLPNLCPYLPIKKIQPRSEYCMSDSASRRANVIEDVYAYWNGAPLAIVNFTRCMDGTSYLVPSSKEKDWLIKRASQYT